jgi:hypothetical protein
VIALDPDIPPELQKVFFICQTNGGDLRWVLNGHTMNGVGNILLILNTSKDIDYNTIIVHSTPDIWTTVIKNAPNINLENKIIIGRTVWEFEKLLPARALENTVSSLMST